MRALVTGAHGFIGARLVQRLVAAGDEVAVFVRAASDDRRLTDVRARIHLLEIDSDDWMTSQSRVKEFAPEAVFHLAWAGVHGGDRDDPHHTEGNVRRTLDLLDVAASAGCTSFVGLGSQAEYGPREGVIDEESPLRPTSAYGAGKLAVGLLIEQVAGAGGMRGAWLRLFSAYGPGDHSDYLIPYLIVELLAGRTPVISAGRQPHDTLYCDDVAAALRAAAVSQRCRGQYVLASGQGVTVRELAETIRDLIDPDAILDFGAPAGHPGWVGSHERLTRDTGWSPSVTLRSGLEQTILWWREHADWGPDSPGNSGSSPSRG